LGFAAGASFDVTTRKMELADLDITVCTAMVGANLLGGESAFDPLYDFVRRSSDEPLFVGRVCGTPSAKSSYVPTV